MDKFFQNFSLLFFHAVILSEWNKKIKLTFFTFKINFIKCYLKMKSLRTFFTLFSVQRLGSRRLLAVFVLQRRRRSSGKYYPHWNAKQLRRLWKWLQFGSNSPEPVSTFLYKKLKLYCNLKNPYSIYSIFQLHDDCPNYSTNSMQNVDQAIFTSWWINHRIRRDIGIHCHLYHGKCNPSIIIRIDRYRPEP